MKCSELTLRRAIECTENLCPIKIIFNGIILYNDYDSDIEIEDGVWGEIKFPLEVIPDRLWQFDKYIVTDINVEIVEFHHSVISMQGYFKEDK